MKFNIIIYWIARLIAGFILAQTLYFKFGAAEESVFIFTEVHMEPWGRIGVGVLELVSVILLLINRTAWMGALLALGLMAGAIAMHLTILGIEVKNDGGLLFFYACLVTVCSVFILIRNRRTIQKYVSSFFPGVR